ncbi:ABC transporter substrate-binding protein [Arthrobacter sp. M4]|nr:ABC transporter substrate-binding protein [Arthrobacter sp. M4]
MLSACSAPSGNVRVNGAGAEGDATLRVGLILDNTGSGTFLNAAQIAAARLAIQEVNAAGGHKGRNVELLPSTLSQDTAAQARALVDAKADVVIGPTDSSRAPAAVDVLARAKIAVISPANTAAGLSSYNSAGFYFRTAASDVAQGGVLAALAGSSGAKRIAILREGGSYGKDVGGATKSALAGAGAETVADVEFTPGKATAAVDRVKAATPDAVVLVARQGAQGALAELNNAGLSGSKILLSDGAVRQYGAELGSGALNGARGVMPGVFPSADFQNRLVAIDPGLKDMTFAAETYDAVNLAAIAAAAAQDDAGSSIAAWLTTISGGSVNQAVAGTSPQSPRTACATYKECLSVLSSGGTPDYEGQSGPINFDDHGDITSASYMVFTYAGDNKASLTGTRSVGKNG